MRIKNCLRDQSGYGLVSLLIALPLLVSLLVGMAALATQARREHVHFRVRQELTDQVNQALAAIEHDLLYAEAVNVTADKIWLACRRPGAVATTSVSYGLKAGDDGEPHVVRGDQPLTGGNENYRVVIRELSFRRTGSRTVVIVITGESVLPKMSYTLRTAVTPLSWKGV